MACALLHNASGNACHGCCRLAEANLFESSEKFRESDYRLLLRMLSSTRDVLFWQVEATI